jgi:hypothetical protein
MRPPLTNLAFSFALGMLPAQAATVELCVTTADGNPRACTIRLARYHGDDEPLTPVLPSAGFRPRTCPPADFVDGAVTLRDLPEGHFVLLVDADEHAMAVSDPFRSGREPAKVKVALRRGTTVVGQVVDEAGKPVAGATVTSDEVAAPAPPTPFAASPAASSGLVGVPRITRAAATTDERGRFELRHLAPGTYTFRAGHAEWCPAQIDAVQLGVDAVRSDLGLVSLRHGAHVVGRFARIGRLQYELELRDAANAPAVGTTLRGTTWSLADGTFRFPQRVPPGRYLLCGRPRHPEQPFGGGSDFGAFQHVIEVPAHEDEVAVPLQAMRN